MLWLLFLIASLLFGRKGGEVEERTFSADLENYIHNGEENFLSITQDKSLIERLATGKFLPDEKKPSTVNNTFLFIYKNTGGFRQLVFWNTQAILPGEDMTSDTAGKGFVKLSNGYYFFQQKNTGIYHIVTMLPVKWEYAVSNDYLKNNFAISGAKGRNFKISLEKTNFPVRAKDRTILFYLQLSIATEKSDDSLLTVWLRILSVIPLLLFIQLYASYLRIKKGLIAGVAFLVGSLLLLRLLSYVFPFPVTLRRFELFDPSIYGSDIILRSLGDLLINAALFFWIISFIRNHLKGRQYAMPEVGKLKKIGLLAAGVVIIVFVTYTGSSIIRSMVADSQISFDVINFFSLNFYSIIGFVVLCCIAIGYYFFCRIILFFLKAVFPDFIIPLFLGVAISGLLLLSFRIGSLSGGFELYNLLWLLLFLLLIKNDLSGYLSSGIVISKLVFWLFFFSASIAAVIIMENSRKELRDRRHYAELIAAKTDPINEVMLNTMLTEFRPEMIAEKFDLFTGEQTAGPFRDSLINNNFNGFTDKYETKVLAYDSAENPLYNADPVSYNSLNSILNTQARPTAVPGLYYFEGGYDKFSYISRKQIRERTGTLLGFLFIIISPKNFENEILYPDIFSSGNNRSLENSSEYAFAIYDKGRLVSSHNDYAFSARYPEKYFAGKQYLSVRKKNYNELWYNAGSDKYVVIVKENRRLLELITLFSYLFCAFLLLSAFSWLISMVMQSRFRLSRIRAEFRFSIRQQVHGTVIFFSAVSFIIIGVATILFFISRYESNNKETLSRMIRVMEKDIKSSVTKDLIQSTICKIYSHNL